MPFVTEKITIQNLSWSWALLKWPVVKRVDAKFTGSEP